MSALTFNGWSAAFTSGFNSNLSLSSFLTVVSESPLLVDLLNQFANDFPDATIDLSGSQKPVRVGIAFDPSSHTIYLDPSVLPTGSRPYTAQQLADALAHELGHALLPNGSNDSNSAATVSEAIQTGLTNEGTAVATEFVVASQLSQQPGGSTIAQTTGFSNQLIASLSADLAAAGGARALSSLSRLEGATGYLGEATDRGAHYYATQRPSIAGPQPSQTLPPRSPLGFTYDDYYGDGWVLKNLYNLSPGDIDWTRMTTGSLQISLQGYKGMNIPVAAGAFVRTGLSSYQASAGETLSFSGASSPQSRGVTTLTTASSATVVGGLANDDVLLGRPGTDTFEIDLPGSVPTGYTTTICEPA